MSEEDIRDPAAMLIERLIDEALADLDELRWRLSGMPNPNYEDEEGNCLHLESGCSWRCLDRNGGNHQPTEEEIAKYLRERLGPALFAVIDGDGEDVRSIESCSIVSDDQLDRLGRIVDTCDNLLVAAHMPVSADIHVTGLKHGVGEIREQAHDLYVELGGDAFLEEPE